MTKRLLLLSALIVVSFTTFAGGLLTNTNQHIAYLRYLARQSSTEIDAIYYNPAGTAFLKEGFSFSINGQSAFQTRTINSTFVGFKGYGDSETKRYRGEASAPFIPSLYGAYKRGHWTFSGSFAVTGGGGKATFSDGLGSFESIISMMPYKAKENFPLTDKYSVNSHVEGSQIIYGLQMGATYQINDYLSFFGGIRMNYVSNKYEGYIRNISANFEGGDNMIAATSLFQGLAKKALDMSIYYESQGQLDLAKQYELKAIEAQKMSEATSDKELNIRQKGWGVTPIIGLHFRHGKWDVGAKYEMTTRLNVENKTRGNVPLFKDGVNTPYDIPGILSAGVTYKFLPTLRGSIGYSHYFDKHAKMADDKQKHIKQGTNEYMAGVEWDVTRWAQVSTGLQRTKFGVGDKYQSDMSFVLSSYSVGLGAGFLLAENVKLNVGYFWTHYDKETKAVENYNNTGLPGKDVFSRTNKLFGVGLDFSF